jgi:hypothetical protein
VLAPKRRSSKINVRLDGSLQAGLDKQGGVGRRNVPRYVRLIEVDEVIVFDHRSSVDEEQRQRWWCTKHQRSHWIGNVKVSQRVKPP